MDIIFFMLGTGAVGFVFSSLLYLLFAKTAYPVQPEEELDILGDYANAEIEEAA